MPASYRQNDWFDRLRFRLVAGLIMATWTGTLATSALAGDAQPINRAAVFDPFEQAQPIKSSEPAQPTTLVVRETPDPKDPFGPVQPAPRALRTDENSEPFHRGLARLASGEQLPGMPPTAAPNDPAGLSPQSGPADWAPKPLGDLSTDIQLPSGMLPRDYWVEHPQATPFVDTCGTNRGWPMDCYHWCPSCLCYQPLYFEEPNLERYGYGCGCCSCCGSTCIQSACSAAHFFGTVPALPYMMGANCPCECNYALGDYRPGDCNPWRYQCCAPCSAVGAVSEGSAAYGLILMLP
jgi:hypothetical protein